MIKPYYEDEFCTIYNADCRDVLPQLEPVDLVLKNRGNLALLASSLRQLPQSATQDALVEASQVLILTDPPYGIQADKAKAHSSIRDNHKWANSDWDSKRPSREVFELLLSVSPHLAIWGGNYFADMLPASSGWLCWRKPEAETGFSLADVELCWTSLAIAARMKSFPRRDGNLHPTQKPLAVIKWTLGFFPNTDLVLDPFMGSGTTLRAAKDLGLKSIGIEIERKYCDIAIERLRQQAFSFTTTA